MAPHLPLTPIQEFLRHYARELDYFDQLARRAQVQCETALQQNGIRAMVTARAKRPDRLQAKLEERNKEKQYASVDAIFEDIVDLAGVRISLYFPGDRAEVDRIIKDRFEIEKSKPFPESNPEVALTKRFSGYWANHFRVRLKREFLPASEERFSTERFEIQVASVVMHAWAEVEHDMLYKPLSGNPSPEEVSILDQLNGLMIAGEVALELLQGATRRRSSSGGLGGPSGPDEPFENHYALGDALAEEFRKQLPDGPKDAVMGRVDIAQKFLQLAGLGRPSGIAPYLKDLTIAEGRDTLVQQLIDRILDANPDLAGKYAQAKTEVGSQGPYSAGPNADAPDVRTEELVLGYLVSRYRSLERAVRNIGERLDRLPRRTVTLPANLQALRDVIRLPEDLQERVKLAREVRNASIHGARRISNDEMAAAGRTFEDALKYLKQSENPVVASAADMELRVFEVTVKPAEEDPYRVWINEVTQALFGQPGVALNLTADQFEYAAKAVAEGRLEWVPGMPGLVALPGTKRYF